MHGTYVGNGRVLVATPYGAKLFAWSDDLGHMPDLVITGVYDVPFTSYLRREVSAGMVCFDVGANIGVFTVLMAWQVGPTGRVVGWEPEPRNLQLLRENIAVNYLNDWTEIVPRGVSDHAGTVPFFRATRFQGTASTIEHDAEYHAHFGGVDEIEQTTIEVEPLDRQVGRFERIDLVKIDVEGAELPVLRGMRGLLDSGTVDRLSVEITRSRGTESDWDELVAELRRLHDAGWRYATLDQDGVAHDLTLDRLIEVGHFSQVLFRRAA